MAIKHWATDTAKLWILTKENNELDSPQPSPGFLPGGAFQNETQRDISEAEQMGNAQGIQGDCISWELQSRVLQRRPESKTVYLCLLNLSCPLI